MGAAGLKKNFIPEIPELLASTPQVAQGMKYTLYFSVPDEPGDYHFICTYPGHGLVMQGTLRCSITQPDKPIPTYEVRRPDPNYTKETNFPIFSPTCYSKNKYPTMKSISYLLLFPFLPVSDFGLNLRPATHLFSHPMRPSPI